MAFGPRVTRLATLTVDRSQLTLVRETKGLLEQLLETFDVMSDKKLLRDIEVSRSQASRGRTRSFRRLLAELDLEPKVRDRSNIKVRMKILKDQT